jgi:tRNA(Ile)-lysidine synthase
LPPDHPLIDRLRRTNAERGLVHPGDRVLAAVSGGPDSLALLHALHLLREELGIELVAAHLSHRMRGEQGEQDALFVREVAAAWGLPAEVEARDVPALARRTGLSLEEAGREARYRFFGRAARRTGCSAIATAHTADDRAETVLLHLFRGTGLDGLAGFPARRPLRPGQPTPTVVRPLIDVTRAEVLDYCAAQSLSPRLDVTNESPVFLRNRIRRELIPLLEEQYSPALRRHLLRLAQLAEEETALLDIHARALLQAATLVAPQPSLTLTPTPTPTPTRIPATLHLSRAALTSAPPALARRALRLAIHSLCPGPPPELATVERLLSLVRGQRPGFSLPGGRISAHITVEELILAPVVPSAPFQASEPVPLEVPGNTKLPWTSGKITAWLVSRRTDDGEPASSPFTLLPTPPKEALMDRASLSGPLTVRPPRPGDRIQPLGMTGHRKLQDLLTDRKVPLHIRRRLPVVCDAEKIVWVAGHCVSEAVRVTPATREAVRLVWEGG